ncbi:fumarylacetoacetate hydrolase family protein [Croceicoccus mobilis]|uniref:2-hydroxyhepta-2,4-diene-1,7-dioate isomerase n=1 Tax=Croceicoccus mobilis TaxID=1703339 RepID=A0A916Z5E9_9SPHN|nr:fumarylacetoacetate hydrolase family protein [Croceicoccus mobilis]GGD77256.1 2-hydroxyhepta-2,4-diene-1,7-dioate isomerase [Croceicoccus mobilis]
MRLVTFEFGNDEKIGALVDGGVLDLASAGTRANRPVPDSMQALIEAGDRAWDNVRALIADCPAEDVVESPKLLSPLPRPIRLRDASLFHEHMEIALGKIGKTMHEEFRRQIIYYNANHLDIYGPEAELPWPARSNWIDYELEWACVVGRTATHITPDTARDHIFGLTIFNDWSARDLQLPFMECGLGPGGGKDFANGLGPCIATLDEFDDIYDLAMTARINGEEWTRGTTGSMFHKWEDALIGLSADYPIRAGEIIGSGTVLSGCGFELDRKLAIGDLVELEIEGIGALRNRIIADNRG